MACSIYRSQTALLPPRELSRLATHKMAMINKAYDEIRAERERYAAQNRTALPES